ncbi:ribonuclease Z, partial [Paenarthrobacter sp. 22069]
LAEQYLHLTAGQAGELAWSGRARTLVLTHFSSRYGDDVSLLAQQARDRAPRTNVIAASDLDRVAVPPRRQPPPQTAGQTTAIGFNHDGSS